MTGLRLSRSVKAVTLAVAGLLLVAAPAHATQITLSFSGTAQASALGGLANKPYSGSFIWESTRYPSDSEDNNVGEYDATAHQLIFNGVNVSNKESGIFVVNNVELFDPGVFVDAVVLGAIIDDSTPTQRFMGVVLMGPPTTWDTIRLPGDLNFLSLLPTRFVFFSDEVPGGGDENDIFLGTGSLTITGASAAQVPEPATLTLTALGLGSMVARARRSRRSTR